MDPVSIGLLSASALSSILTMANRMGDKSGQKRIRKLLSQAQARNTRDASAIAASGTGINPALAQRSALESLAEANTAAQRSAMNQEAAMAVQDRARTDRLAGGALGAVGAFGSQLLAARNTAAKSAADPIITAKLQEAAALEEATGKPGQQSQALSAAVAPAEPVAPVAPRVPGSPGVSGAAEATGASEPVGVMGEPTTFGEVRERRRQAQAPTELSQLIAESAPSTTPGGSFRGPLDAQRFLGMPVPAPWPIESPVPRADAAAARAGADVEMIPGLEAPPGVIPSDFTPTSPPEPTQRGPRSDPTPPAPTDAEARDITQLGGQLRAESSAQGALEARAAAVRGAQQRAARPQASAPPTDTGFPAPGSSEQVPIDIPAPPYTGALPAPAAGRGVGGAAGRQTPAQVIADSPVARALRQRNREQEESVRLRREAGEIDEFGMSTLPPRRNDRPPSAAPARPPDVLDQATRKSGGSAPLVPTIEELPIASQVPGWDKFARGAGPAGSQAAMAAMRQDPGSFLSPSTNGFGLMIGPQLFTALVAAKNGVPLE